MKKKISVIIGFALSAALLFAAAGKINFPLVLESYSRLDAGQIASMAAILVFGLFLRGLRWKLLLAPCTKTSAWTMTKLETIGLALNNVLPLRLGEVARATIGGPLLGAPILTLAATIVVERVLDVLSISLIFALAAGGEGALSWTQGYGGLAWVLVGGAAAGLLILVFLDELVAHSKTFCAALGKFPKLERLVRQAAMGAEALRNWKLAAGIISIGMLLWFNDAFGYFWGAGIMGLNPPLSYSKAMTVLCAAAVSVSVPAMPGYFGPFELAVQRTLMAWGTDKNLSLAYAAFIHVNVYIITTGLGIIFLYQTGHSLGGIWKRIYGGKRADATPGS